MNSSEFNKYVLDNWHWRDKNKENILANSDLIFSSLGMVCEAGEAGDVIKKLVRGDEVDPKDFLNECGDVLHYMSRCLYKLGYTFEDAFAANKEKLDDRRLNGKKRA